MINIEESITYQEIFRKGEALGRLEEALDFLVLLGTERLGRPNAAALRKLRAINDRKQLHRLGLRINSVESWKDLLAVK